MPRKHRPLVFASPGRFEIICHHSVPTDYPEEFHPTIQVCIPMDDARYRVIRSSESGRELVHDLDARDVLVIPTGQPHAIMWQRPAGIVSLQLAETFVEQALDIPRLVLPDTFTVRDPFISAAALQLREALQSEGGIGPAFGEALAVAIAYRIGVGAARAHIRVMERVQTFASHQLSIIDRYIDERLDQPIAVGELAALVALTRWHFMRRFQASAGCSPHEYITRRRIAHAQTLLATTQLTISEIALDVGISHSHFSRTFIQRVGVSPREYRHQRQGQR